MDENLLGLDMNFDLDNSTLLDSSFHVPLPNLGDYEEGRLRDVDIVTGQELIEMGLQETLPAQEMVDDL